MTHTPGPWYAICRMVEVDDDDHADICTTNPDLFGQGHLAPPIEEQQANARLIAASPDLLEALEALVAHCHEQERLITEEMYHVDYCGESLPLIIARAAIAAAK